jgi:predicted glycosyltransferase involved in capsule biosynthesis
LRDLSILIPFDKNSSLQRKKVFTWVYKYYRYFFPSAEVCIGDCPQTEPFSKSTAINNAAKEASKNNYVIVDADIICDPNLIKESIGLLKKHSWVIPYSKVRNLTKKSTEDLIRGGINSQIKINQYTYHERNVLPVGGINILPKAHFNAVHGFDERFIGWGGEDDAFAASVNAICGHYKRLNQPIYHLWHSKSNRKKDYKYSNNLSLAQKYCAAQNNTAEMQKIIESRIH